MTITVRFAHLAKRPEYCIGEKFRKGDKVGNMGETGVAVGAHLHMDNGEGQLKACWKLRDAEDGRIKSAPRQLNRFVTPELFGGDPEDQDKRQSIRVTTPYADHEYQRAWKKVHMGYDVSTDEPWPWNIYWPIEEEGTCEAILDDASYGWVSLISYYVVV